MRNIFPLICMTFTPSSQRNLSMTCPNPSHRTMQWNLSWMWLQKVVRSIHSPLQNKRSWMPFSRRTLIQDRFDLPSPWWLLQSSSLKRRMAAFSWYRTIRCSTPWPWRISTHCCSSWSWSQSSRVLSTSQSWMSDGVSTISRWRKVMNGRPLSVPTMDCLRCSSCSLASSIAGQLSNHDGCHLWGPHYQRVVIVYLDDILIFTETLEEHQAVICCVMELLEKHKLYLWPDKWEFEKMTVKYLRVIISHNSVTMDPVKVDRVAEWPTLMNKKEGQSFLGFTNFYWWFIRGFFKHPTPSLTSSGMTPNGIGGPMNNLPLTSSNGTSHQPWSSSQTKLFHIEANSSDFITRTVLSQVSLEDEKWHPIMFFSKSLSLVEQNYKIHDKEMLAIIWSLQEWRHFVKGTKHQCEIWMNHKNLEYFMTAKQLNWRQAWWSLYLTWFNFLLHHKPGKLMGKPDTLSCRADHGTSSNNNSNITLLTPSQSQKNIGK